MLHDLYLLSCYFEPSLAVMYEDDMKRRYGAVAIQKAVQDGFLDLHQTPCLFGRGKCFYSLSSKGLQTVEGNA
jgi:hypothetical protein